LKKLGVEAVLTAFEGEWASRADLHTEPGDFRFHICKLFSQRQAEAFPRFQTVRQYINVMDPMRVVSVR